MDYSSPEAKAFCIRLRRLIKRLGPHAFAFHEKGVLYSGPDGDIIAKIGTGFRNNVERSLDQANAFKAITINETRIGKLLDRLDLEFRFTKIFDPGVPDQLIKDAIFDVWSCASREFVRSSFKHASTAVCGASSKRVFRKHELKVTITQKTNVETINGVSIQHYKDIYKKYKNPSEGFYAAFVEICRTELTLFYGLAITAPVATKDKAWEEYNSRKLFFDTEQSLTTKATVRKILAAMTGHRAAITGKYRRPRHVASSKVALKP